MATVPQTSDEHIKQLAEIDRDVVKLIKSAGLALKALTPSHSSSEDDANCQVDIEEGSESFTVAASEYFNLLSSIDIRLRRQINALEEADIIPAESTSRESQSNVGVQATMTGPASIPNGAVTKPGGTRKGAITGGGLGSLDVGWLNSRNDNVGKEMEAELWERAQIFVEMQERKNAGEVDGKASPRDYENVSQQPRIELEALGPKLPGGV
ncbi:MAG: hypothetical protein Q9217_003158 [Psora testacea]